MAYDWPTDRIDYVPITERDPLPLPDGARVIVWPCINVEHWQVDQSMPRTIFISTAGMKNPVPDIPNWAWHEYGQRVGFWRLKAIFDEFEAPATLIINGSVCDSYPQIVDAAIDSGWDTAGHGWIQKSLPAVEDQRGDIIKTYQRITEHTGTPPRGWLGPALAETQDTVDWLKEAGFEYVADWVLDDQPVDIRTRHGTLVGLPYTGELNDLAMILIQAHRAAEYADRAIDEFEQLISEYDQATRVMCFTLHPYIMGTPSRARHVQRILEHVCGRDDVKVWTGSQILDWYNACKGRS